MSMLPFFIEMKNREILFIGGGAIAARRIEKLAEAEAKLTIVSPAISPEVMELIRKFELPFWEETYEKARLHVTISDYFLICSATNDLTTDELIYKDALEAKVLCNIASDRHKSDLYFPGIVKAEDLTIAVSTEGMNPAKTKEICRDLRENLKMPVKEDLE